MKILTPVSLGELYDKISILEIKSARIVDEQKLTHVHHELAALRAVAAEYPIEDAVYKSLKEINEHLWDVEDALREKESAQVFDTTFTELARQVYILNDRRSEIKKEINLSHGSDIVEVKSYKGPEKPIQ